mmetsp:Transcript_15461/g.52433  ORF Transcript_15461/g.52433 Transcript_15461/m.52433 type:complete len:277 (-) Transcript_15461:455-1285(-)
MGLFCDGRNLFLPLVASYTERGVLTTLYLRTTALLPSAAISEGNSRPSSSIVAAIMSSSDLEIHSLAGAKTSSRWLLSSSRYSRHVLLMSAYTLRSGDLLKSRWSTVVSLRSNHTWMLMTGTPVSSSRLLKYVCRSFQGAGVLSFITSTGMADTYASAVTAPPPCMRKHLTLPSSSSSMRSRRELMTTSPPLARISSTMGWHRRSGGAPSRKAILEPCVSWRKRFSAVRTTVMDRLSGSIKLSALAMAMNTSSFTRSGTPCFFIHSDTLSSSCSDT